MNLKALEESELLALARNPQTEQSILFTLLHFDDGRYARPAYKTLLELENEDKISYEYLVKNGDYDTHVGMIRFSETEEDIIEEISLIHFPDRASDEDWATSTEEYPMCIEEENYSMILELLKNEKTNFRIIADIYNSNSEKMEDYEEVYVLISGHPEVWLQHVESILMYCDDFENYKQIQRNALEQNDLSREAIFVLALDEDVDIANEAMRHWRYEKPTPELLVQLAESEIWLVCEHIFRHPLTPPDLKERLRKEYLFE